MSERPAEKDDAELAAAAGIKKSSPIVPIVLVLNTVLLGGLLVKTLLAPSAAAPVAEGDHGGGAKGDGGGRGAPAREAGAALGPTLKLPDFVVHLRDPEAERFARISFELEVGAEPEKERLAANMPKIRELFISYLSDRTTEELRGSEGMDRVKRELMARLEEHVPSTPVRSVYITDIVIQ